MNKKEMSEIKKIFSNNCGLFTLNRVVYAYVDAERNIKTIDTKSYAMLSDDVCEVIMETLKKSLSGVIGKNLNEYAFSDSAYETGGAQNVLYNVLQDKLDNVESTDELMKRIVNNGDYSTAYSVIIGHCTYNVMSKDKNDDSTGDCDDTYNFMVGAICPANTGDNGLFYDSENNIIAKKSNTKMIISKVPTEGFLFPVFSDRMADINSIMTYTKSAKKPNLAFIEDVMECHFEFTADKEKELFHSILTDVCGDELDYTVITDVNNKIKDIIAQHKNETEITTIDCSTIKYMLADVGVSVEKLTALETIYQQKVGKSSLKATNLVENKTTLALAEITVNVDSAATEKVRTSVIQGRKCLIIDLDDSGVAVNGIPTPIEASI